MEKGPLNAEGKVEFETEGRDHERITLTQASMSGGGIAELMIEMESAQWTNAVLTPQSAWRLQYALQKLTDQFQIPLTTEEAIEIIKTGKHAQAADRSDLTDRVLITLLGREKIKAALMPDGTLAIMPVE